LFTRYAFFYSLDDARVTHAIRIYVAYKTPCTFAFVVAVALRSYLLHIPVSLGCLCNFFESTFLLAGFS